MKTLNTERQNQNFINCQFIIQEKSREENDQAKEISINNFNANKTPSNLQRIKNAGIQPKELINNEWKPLNSWQDGFNEYHDALPLYDKINGIFTIIGIGFYKKLDK